MIKILWRKMFKYKEGIELILSVAQLLLILIPILIVIIAFFRKEFISILVLFVYDNQQFIINSSILLLAIANLLFIIQMRKKMELGFADNFSKSNIIENWDYAGDWEVSNRTLIVTNSEQGGITRKGKGWENYIFCFETNIINKYSGWIIRADNANDYCMLQCSKTGITPHRRFIQYQKIKDSTGREIEVPVAMWVKGIEHKFSTPLQNWFRVAIKVKGASVTVFIEGALVFHRSNFTNFMNNPTGRVGFRCAGDEQAHFRNVYVQKI